MNEILLFGPFTILFPVTETIAIVQLLLSIMKACCLSAPFTNTVSFNHRLRGCFSVMLLYPQISYLNHIQWCLVMSWWEILPRSLLSIRKLFLWNDINLHLLLLFTQSHTSRIDPKSNAYVSHFVLKAWEYFRYFKERHNRNKADITWQYHYYRSRCICCLISFHMHQT